MWTWKQVTKDGDYNTILENKIDELQVNSRKPSFEIKNVPQTCNENKEDLVGYVANLSGTLDCTILKSDIADIYRRRSAKHLSFLKVNPDTPIYISEHQTRKRKRLYFLIGDLAKTQNFKFC